MIDWEGMFAGARDMVRAAEGLEDGIRQLYAFAARNPAVYDEPKFWERVASAQFPFDTLDTWVREGLIALDSAQGQAILVLDCGDCPDIFRLEACLVPSTAAYEDFGQYAKSNVVVAGEDFARASIKEVRVLTQHHVTELNHPILSYPLYDKGWHGANGYLLWLGVASLALCQPLRDAAVCRSILGQRDKMLVMSGYEEIFFTLGSVSTRGLSIP